MDTPGHGLWSALLFWWTGHPILAAIMGMIPDLIGFMPITVYGFFQKDTREKGFLEAYDSFAPWIKKYTEIMYNPTHSLIVAIVICAAVLILFPGAWWILAYPLHILIDIPTHTRQFYPTPFLWPISSYTVDGISWARPTFMIPHYSLLIMGWILFLVLG